MKKLIALLLCVCLLLSAAACTNAPAADKSTDASNQDGEQRLRIVATLQSQQINFWSNVQHTLERLAKEENVDLTIMDLNGDVTTFANVIDDIVAMKPDGVITCGLETSTLGIHVKTLQDAGIPVVTYNISPEGATCPQVVADQSEFGRVAGTAAAEYWKENHPDTTPVGGAVDLYSAPQCKERVDGFVEGFRTVYPDFEVVQSVEAAARARFPLQPVRICCKRTRRSTSCSASTPTARSALWMLCARSIAARPLILLSPASTGRRPTAQS